MAKTKGKTDLSLAALVKTPTGVRGLDEITGGGLPKGRTTLIAGAAGCGKTVFAMEFLVNGATQFNEPGVFVSFEEPVEDLVKNFSSLGYDLNKLSNSKEMIVDYIHIERSEIEVTGEYDLEGLFIRLEHMVNSIGAKRIALDTIESLFGALPNEGILRAEIRRLFRWLKSKGLTAVITGEKGAGLMTRHGLEEYVSDCVIFLDHHLAEQVATRRMRIVKYRGSLHGTNEYPFLIDNTGFSVLPVTSLELTHKASSERISTGIPRLDTMLEGKGYYRGSSILVSGTAGTGKSSIAATFADSVCRRGERCLYLAFEESESQIIRNMRSIGINLEPWVKKGLLKIQASRPTFSGLEMHLVQIHNLIGSFNPGVVVFDPITNMISVGSENEVKSMLIRLIDYLKMKLVTTLFTNLSHQENIEQTTLSISSLMDTLILLRDIEIGGERNRGLYILKARGIGHSNQIREFMITKEGIDICDVYLGQGKVLTGSARLAQEAAEKAEALIRREETEQKQRELERKREAMESQIKLLRSQYEVEEEVLRTSIQQAKLKEDAISGTATEMAKARKADVIKPAAGKKDSRRNIKHGN
jgi:circadian clock protein KaiC